MLRIGSGPDLRFGNGPELLELRQMIKCWRCAHNTKHL
jgi:hypothetical protein